MLILPFSKDAVKRLITTTKNAAFLSLLLSPSAQALTCVPVTAVHIPIAYITTNAISCGATEWAVFTPVDLTAYNTAVLAAAAVTSVPVSFSNGIAAGAALVSVMLIAWGFSAVREVLR